MQTKRIENRFSTKNQEKALAFAAFDMALITIDLWFNFGFNQSSVFEGFVDLYDDEVVAIIMLIIIGLFACVFVCVFVCIKFDHGH